MNIQSYTNPFGNQTSWNASAAAVNTPVSNEASSSAAAESADGDQVFLSDASLGLDQLESSEPGLYGSGSLGNGNSLGNTFNPFGFTRPVSPIQTPLWSNGTSPSFPITGTSPSLGTGTTTPTTEKNGPMTTYGNLQEATDITEHNGNADIGGSGKNGKNFLLHNPDNQPGNAAHVKLVSR